MESVKLAGVVVLSLKSRKRVWRAPKDVLVF